MQSSELMAKRVVFYILTFALIATTQSLKAEGASNENIEVNLLSQDDLKSAYEKEALPDGWEELKFKKIKSHTVYKVIDSKDSDKVFSLRAFSKASASGLVKEVRIDLKKYPVLKWKWRVGGTLVGGDATQKSGDDYPARIYITFKYDPDSIPFWERVKYKTAKLLYGDVPARAINYIWANKMPLGTHRPNAYTDKVVMFAVRSGDGHKGQWLEESRNVFNDYMKAFGTDKVPPEVVSVAIMTDTDNTGEEVESYYKDIVFTEVDLDN